jgi:hypothetical protein
LLDVFGDQTVDVSTVRHCMMLFSIGKNVSHYMKAASLQETDITLFLSPVNSVPKTRRMWHNTRLILTLYHSCKVKSVLLIWYNTCALKHIDTSNRGERWLLWHLSCQLDGMETVILCHMKSYIQFDGIWKDWIA